MTPFAASLALLSLHKSYTLHGPSTLYNSSSFPAAATLGGMLGCLLFKFPYSKAFCDLVADNMLGWYKDASLTGSLDSISKENTLFMVHPHGILSVGTTLCDSFIKSQLL